MRSTLLALVIALLACKSTSDKPHTPPDLGMTPAEVLTADSSKIDGADVRVTGKVASVEELEPGEDAVQRFELEAGSGKVLAGQMGGTNCVRGFCYEKPPPVGATATLKCRGVVEKKVARVVDCERLDFKR